MINWIFKTRLLILALLLVLIASFGIQYLQGDHQTATGLALLLVLIASVVIPQVTARWWVAYRLYGGFPVSLGRHMLHYARRTPQRNVVGVTGFLFLVTVTAFVAHFTYAWPPLEIAILSLAPTIYFASGTALNMLPPSVLFLSASSDQSIMLFTSLADRLPLYRPVALLRPSGQQTPSMTIHLKMNIIRTIKYYEWRSTVFHLMDVVPLIVIDVCETTALVEEELTRIKQKGYQERCYLIQQQTSVDNLASLIQQKLRKPVDLTNRSKRQSEFARIFSNTPPSLRDPQTAADYVRKAQAIENYAAYQFLKDCKQPGLPPNENRLFEDVPSKMTREAEKKYLRSNRALEEVELIYKSALEDQEQSPADSNPFRGFNIAVACIGLGGVERMRCNWGQAIECISDAIQRLNALLDESSPAEHSDINNEIATAHFKLGDIYMARYRDEKNEQDRQKAISNFQEALRIDSALGADLTLTKKRLSGLGKGTAHIRP